MKKIILIFLFFFSFTLFTNADDNINKVFKIESYEFNELTNSFVLTQYGSSIYIENNLIYTNAHVILDSENEPIGNYRVCKTTNFKDKPECFTVGKLLYYDTKNDLAVLSISNPGTSVVTKSNKTLKVGDDVNVYGYPSNGGDTITYTKGKISGYESGLYKIDANIDAGNSGGGVFDSDGNLIGIATSVKVGYTTLGYIIPINKIDDFKNKKNVNSLKYYEKGVDKNFFKNTLIVKNIIGNTSLNNSEIKLKNFSKYGFDITNYQEDINKKFFIVGLRNDNKETFMIINNSSILGVNNDIMEDIYKNAEEEAKKLKDNGELAAYKIKKLKLKNKDTTLMFFSDKKGNVSLTLMIEVSKNNYQIVSISSDNIKNKSFLNGVKLILNCLELNEIVNSNENVDYLLLDNLKIGKKGIFYVTKNIDGDKLTTIGNDITVYQATSSKTKTEDFEDYTLLSYIKEDYNYYKEDYYYNFSGIKQTKNKEYYTYSFYKNNEFKGEEIDKDEKKYAITVEFFDYIDKENFYINNLTFEFDKLESKDIILDFINTIKTSSGKLPFELGDVEVDYNLVKAPEF